VKRPYPVLYWRRRVAASAHIRTRPSLFPCQPMQQDSIKEWGREEERDKRGDVNMMSLHSLVISGALLLLFLLSLIG